jgi:NAD(P)-dependent dehydrogenase (short-subunit alcohol dehydrogenase family)
VVLPGISASWSAYCASKAAAVSLTLALADELALKNVQVNVIKKVSENSLLCLINN